MGEIANEMIDRIAASLERSFKSVITAMAGIDFDETGVVTPAPDVWRGYARAAIEEMREPTDRMIRASHILALVYENDTLANGDEAYQAMIDAALE